MNSKQKLFKHSSDKKAQNLLFSYLFYLIVSLPVLLATFFFTNALITEVEEIDEYQKFLSQSNHFIQNFLRAYELPGTAISFNNSQIFINSEAVIRTSNEFSSFETQQFTFFYRHQIPFCENYLMALMNIDNVQIDTNLGCMRIERKITLFDE